MKVMLGVYLIVFLVAGYAISNDYNVINIEKDIAETIEVESSNINLWDTNELDGLDLFLYKSSESDLGFSGYNCLMNTFCDPIVSDLSSLEDGDVFTTFLETSEKTYIVFYGKNETNSVKLSYTFNGDSDQVSLPLNKLYFMTFVPVSESVDITSEPTDLLFE